MDRTVLGALSALVAALSLAGCAASSMHTLGSTDCQRLAQPGDSKIQIYCRAPERNTPATEAKFLTPVSEQISAGTTCRRAPRLAGSKIRTICSSTADWDKFDTWAASAGVTCRWSPAPGHNVPSELCLTAARWEAWALQQSRPSRAAGFTAGANWPGNGIPQPTPPAYATSYGFSSTGVVGQ
jgi:hypothetical protein